MRTPSVSVPTPLKNTTREHVHSLVIALLCIVVAALVLRATDSFPDHEQVRGGLDETVQLDKGMVTFTNLRAGSVAIRPDRDNEVVARSEGIFLVVDVVVQAPDEKGGFNRSVLHGAGDRTYERYESLSSSFNPVAGFESHGSVMFEVDPDDLEGLVLEAWEGSIFTAFEEHLHIDLGITAEQAAELRAQQGEDVDIVYGTVDVAIP